MSAKAVFKFDVRHLSRLAGSVVTIEPTTRAKSVVLYLAPDVLIYKSVIS